MFYGILFGVIMSASFLFAMLGLGGALVYVPVLKWAGFPVKEVAIPTALLLNGFTTIMALTTYARHKLVDWKGGLALAASAFLFAPLGAYATRFIPVKGLLILFSVAVGVAAIRMILFSRQPEPDKMFSIKARSVIGAIVGAFAGFMAGLLGVGGGFIIAPLLIWMGYKTKQAAATTAFAVAFSSFSGFLGHLAAGHFEPGLTAVLVLAVLAGSFAGSRFMVSTAKPKWVKQLYVLVLLTIAVKLLYGVF